jgi:hypothetical protein
LSTDTRIALTLLGVARNQCDPFHTLIVNRGIKPRKLKRSEPPGVIASSIIVALTLAISVLPFTAERSGHPLFLYRRQAASVPSRLLRRKPCRHRRLDGAAARGLVSRSPMAIAPKEAWARHAALPIIEWRRATRAQHPGGRRQCRDEPPAPATTPTTLWL